MTVVGELVGRGRTSDVYAYGTDSVIKIAHDDVPADWPTFEARLTNAVWNMGVAAPQVREVVEFDGRPAVVFQRIEGPSMWQCMLDEPERAPALARHLVDIQRQLMQVDLPTGVPDFVDRLVRRIRVAPGLDAAGRAEAELLVADLPRGAALLHGDLHPGNVLMSTDGPVVIDWFDATIGHPVADIVRSSILMQAGTGAAPRHLPHASDERLRQVQRAYLAGFRSELEVARDDLSRWQGVIAAGRLAEHAEPDAAVLMQLWGRRLDAASGQSLLVD